MFYSHFYSMHPVLEQISKHLDFVPKANREKEALYLLYEVVGMGETDLLFVASIELNRREKKLFAQMLDFLKAKYSNSSSVNQQIATDHNGMVAIKVCLNRLLIMRLLRQGAKVDKHLNSPPFLHNS